MFETAFPVDFIKIYAQNTSYIQSNIFTKNVQMKGKVTQTHSGPTTNIIKAAMIETAK